ncbi:MotA/TolQ/ExbB proton channel [Pseudodesulfovibrio mercurii]|uniref:MotA/TolQ/ExbB proton channel n=1 Tax=Pseudodesulfovibrio mercurii TaxID=641491 RepID=F0JDU4_9BACT|nr:MotA/TolQ/ExbB proton channel family protein [Pseudodesulfovibrio mercurii]EGB14626.1 MotA/TolQ/ExbB proton channel [Pseudodesulfovibrio mercurii]
MIRLARRPIVFPILRLRLCPALWLLLCLAVAVPVLARTARAADDATARLDGLARDMTARTGAVNKLLDLDRDQLRTKVAALRKARDAERARLDKAVAELARLRGERAELAARYDAVAGEMRAVEDAVRSNAAQARTLLAASALTSLVPDRLAPLDRVARSRDFPGLPTITGLGGLLLDEIRSGATAETRPGTFLGPDGRTRTGGLLRAGSLFLGARDEDGRTCLLTPGSTPPQAVAATPGEAEKAMAAWADGAGQVLPVDPSHGAALSLLQARRTLDDWVQGGGLLLWPILVIGLAALLVVFYKGARLFLARPCPRDFALRLRTAWDADGPSGLTRLLKSLPRTPAARVLLWAAPDADPELRDKRLQEGFLAELHRLESGLGFIAVMAAVAPLLGLLGTVTGMIDSFQAVTVFGTANPRIMSSGISEALITTQAGLGVAIPAMLLHQFLKQRVQGLASDMEQQCAAFQALLAANPDKDGAA